MITRIGSRATDGALGGWFRVGPRPRIGRTFAAPAHAARDPVVTVESGKLKGVTETLSVASADLPGHSLCGATDRRFAVARAAACRPLVGHSQRDRVRSALHAAAALLRHDVPLACAERRLPLSERLDAGQARRRSGQAAGARVHLRRRLHGRRRFGKALRRRLARKTRHRRRHSQLPAGRVRFLLPSRADGGLAASRIRQLRPARSGRGAGLGEAQHRGVRRRPEPDHHRRRVPPVDRRSAR